MYTLIIHPFGFFDQPRFVFCAARDGGGRWRNWNFSEFAATDMQKVDGWKWPFQEWQFHITFHDENLLLRGDSVCRENGVVEFFQRGVNLKGVVRHPDWIQKQWTWEFATEFDMAAWDLPLHLLSFGKATLRLKGPKLIRSWPTRVINLVQTDSKRFLSTPMCSYNVSGQNVSQDDSIFFPTDLRILEGPPSSGNLSQLLRPNQGLKLVHPIYWKSIGHIFGSFQVLILFNRRANCIWFFAKSKVCWWNSNLVDWIHCFVITSKISCLKYLKM